MITSEDKIYIMDLIEKLIPDILKEIHFDANATEPGKSYAFKFEEVFIKKLLDIDDDFSVHGEDGRKIAKNHMADILYKGNYINIKFGYKKNGQPNLCAGNKLFDYLAGVGGKSKDIEIDSYYVISVDAYGPTYMFYDVYEYLNLDCFHYDAGPSQFMIKESVIKKVYEFNKKIDPLDKKATLNIICELMDIGAHKTYELRKKKIQEKRDIINEYKQSTLQQFCAA